MVRPATDSPAHVAKLREVHRVMSRELGTLGMRGAEEAARDPTLSFLAVTEGRVVGCVIVEPVHCAFRWHAGDDTDALVREEDATDAVELGVDQVWVHAAFRRRGIAHTLLEVARTHALVGRVVPRERVAFSQPTRDGRALARAFVGGWVVLVFR